MNQPAINIERVVREVLAELGVAPSKSPLPLGEGQSEGRAAPQGPAALTLALSGHQPKVGRERGPDISPRPLGDEQGVRADGVSNEDALTLALSGHQPKVGRERGRVSSDLVVTSRVVTMAEISGRLESVRRLFVAREAVVTPAVRDELLVRGIALERADSSSEHDVATFRLAVVTSGTDFDPTALTLALARQGVCVERSNSDCPIAATDQLAGELAKPNTLGVLLTAHVAAGLCLANRLRGVRAVSGADAPAVAMATAAVGANLLVADPRATSFFQLKQIFAEFCRGGVHPCPEVFRTRLA